MTYTHAERTKRWRDRKAGILPPFKRHTESAQRRYDYKNKYGIDVDEYNEMLRKQNGKCAICGNKERDGKRLGVDHDHKTNEVRELLCKQCNLGISNFKEDIELLRNAIKYIERHV